MRFSGTVANGEKSSSSLFLSTRIIYIITALEWAKMTIPQGGALCDSDYLLY